VYRPRVEQVLEVKLLPPGFPQVLVARPRLEALLVEAGTRRLTSIVAPAGFGKSTLLAIWANRQRCAWYTLTPEDRDVGTLFRGIATALGLRVPGIRSGLAAASALDLGPGPTSGVDESSRAQASAAVLASLLDEHLSTELFLVLDDVHEIEPASGSARLVEALCRQAPHRTHLVFASRAEPPFPIGRLRAQGQLLELSGTTLSFAEDETASLLSGVAGRPVAPVSAARLHEATGGWPAAVRLAAEALPTPPSDGAATADDDDGALRRAGGRVFAVLAEEVFQRADPAVTELVAVVAPLERFTAALCEDALGYPGAGRTLAELEQRGLFLVPHGGPQGWYSLQPLVREYAREHLAGDATRRHDALLAAATWLEANGTPREALRCLAEAGDGAGIARVLTRHGTVLLATGAADDVIRHAASLAPELRSPVLDQLEGEAHHARGDWAGALECFGRLAAPGDPLPAGAAWRMGLIHHQRGDLDAALALYERGAVGPGDDRDRALLLAWSAAARWLRGDLDSCRKLGDDAFALAHACGDDRALAAAHTALAMVAALDGDRRANDAHYLRALDHAERAGDALQLIRIRTNRGSRCFEEGDYADAIVELDAAIRMADLTGFAALRALALTNRGQAMHQLGRLEEAVDDLEAAKAEYQRLGARMVAYPIARLGDIHRARGDTALARAAYEEAVALAGPVGDLQGLVPALAGLARVLVDEDPEQAEELANRAVAVGPALGRTGAIAAVGWVALSRGDRERAAASAVEAAAAARRHRDRAGLAEALQLTALAATDPARARSALHEAQGLWQSLGCPLGQAAAELALARLTEGPDAVALATRAERGFRRAGARADAVVAADLRAALGHDTPAPVVICALGAFRVLRDGVPVPGREWQSRMTRDLLKILVAHDGPVRREVVLDALWPDDDRASSASKLSVSLTTARAVLDPSTRFGPDHFVAADRDSVWLERDNLQIDVDSFLATAHEGLRLRADGRDAAAAEILAAAEASFGGDPFDEDAYEDWAAGVRERTRATYFEVARAVADDAWATGDHDGAVRLLLRILERDPYDERAHLALVSSLAARGRHGDAHRMFRTYCARMDELNVEPAPFPLPAGLAP
jgi:DNA-binding SARP family transcriptional activator/tetratricopeptide (TPR) repeat protein